MFAATFDRREQLNYHSRFSKAAWPSAGLAKPKGRLGCLYEQLVMIGHQAIRMAEPAIPIIWRHDLMLHVCKALNSHVTKGKELNAICPDRQIPPRSHAD
jgi:hypothetical protein